ncbi:aldehyde dehydrogenase [Pontibacter sp. MBLB2868]|uniref:aldehyde dehydrogenase n=1 Tax=Pontibacter sp. MBLB2868 TaxID=3451555 RepID=UPI003F75438E
MATSTQISRAIIPPAETSRVHIQQLVQKQREFFNRQGTLDLEFRKQQLNKLLQAVRQKEQQITEALYADFRKPPFESFATEIGFIDLELKHTLRNLDKWAKPKGVKETLLNFPGKSYILPEPYGLTLLIAPWNYPFQLMMAPLIGAVAAGNCALLKPSELTPHISAVIADLVQENFAEEHIAVVQGGVPTTQHLLEQHFDYIFFTGSTKVGKIIMKAAAETLTPVTLELGGKSPAIVTEDADLELAARRITWGKFVNAGQTCVAPDYVLVQEQVKEEFVQLLAQTIKTFYGDFPAESPDFARIVNKDHFNRLKSYLNDGNIRAGGETDEHDLYIAPTVMDQVTWQQPVMQEEIFGPILPVLTFRNLQEAIQTVNKRERPLALYVFSSSKSKQNLVLDSIPFGGGCINDTLSHLANPNLPFGGVGSSGMGSYHGQTSFNLFSHQKSILKRGTWLDLPLRYPPYGNRLSMLQKFFQWL